MKKIYFLSSFSLMCGLMIYASFNNTEDLFYYAYNEKVYLTISDELKAFINFKQFKDSIEVKERILYNVKTSDFQINKRWGNSYIIKFHRLNDLNEFVNKFSSQSDVSSVYPYYKTNDGMEIGLIDEILVQFLDNISNEEITSLLKYLNIEVKEKEELYYILAVPNNLNTLEIANKIQESNLVKFSHPNFLVKAERFQQFIPNDQYFNSQFPFHNTGQVINDGHIGTADADVDAPEAWALTRGTNNIIIAVIDEGVTRDHPDLPEGREIILNGSNFAAPFDGTNPDQPFPVENGNHGNSCAGVIAATQNNNQGISGLAPNCRIMPIRIFYGPVTDALVNSYRNAINFAWNNNADIISCSWGFPDANPNAWPVIREAIYNATVSGRGNRGCVVVFAVGNSADHADTPTDPGWIQFPSNVTVTGVLSVGASDRNDFQANYSPTSNPGSPNNQIIDVAAPSNRSMPWNVILGETYETWTIDIPLNPGYNPYKDGIDFPHPPPVNEQLPNNGVNFLSYTGRFGGTSHACPVVSGIAALILSINPNLLQGNVFSIITSTADHVGGYVYTNGRCNELGDGRVNACRAVRQAILNSGNITASSDLALCYQSQITYTLNNITTVATVSWSASPSNLFQTASGTGMSATLRPQSISSTGPATITFNIPCACGTIAISRSIQVGKLNTSQFTVTGQMNPCAGQTYQYTASVYVPGYQYMWTYPAFWYPVYYEANYIILRVPQYSSGSGTVNASINDGCGYSGYSGMPVYWHICYGYNFVYYPNPSSEEINVEAIDETTGKTFESNIIDFSVNIFDSNENLVKTGLSNQNKITIHVSDLKKGMYFLHIIDKDQVIKEQIIIE